jgi:hypothetical protein
MKFKPLLPKIRVTRVEERGRGSWVVGRLPREQGSARGIHLRESNLGRGSRSTWFWVDDPGSMICVMVTIHLIFQILCAVKYSTTNSPQLSRFFFQKDIIQQIKMIKMGLKYVVHGSASSLVSWLCKGIPSAFLHTKNKGICHPQSGKRWLQQSGTPVSSTDYAGDQELMESKYGWSSISPWCGGGVGVNADRWLERRRASGPA